MRAMITVDINHEGVPTGASFTVYDSDGRVAVSERSSGRNVAKRPPAAIFDGLLAQALKVLEDVGLVDDLEEDY